MKKSGTFITFEGGEGCGKSTQIGLLKERFAECGIDAIFTREPGGCGFSERVRELMLNRDYPISARTEALLQAASREEHLAETILPALTAGKTVVSDRFLDSSFAYQGGGRGLSKIFIAYINATAAECAPDLTLFIDLPPENGLLRIPEERRDRIESEKIAFHQRVHEIYLDLAKEFPERIVRIDGTLSPVEMFAAVLDAVRSHTDLKI